MEKDAYILPISRMAEVEQEIDRAISRDVPPPGGGCSDIPSIENNIGNDGGAGFSDEPFNQPVFVLGTRVMLVTDVKLRLNKEEGLVLKVVKKPFMVLEHPVKTDDSRSWSYSESTSDTVAVLKRMTVVTKSIYNPDSHKFINENSKLLYLGDESYSNDKLVFQAEPVCTG